MERKRQSRITRKVDRREVVPTRGGGRDRSKHGRWLSLGLLLRRRGLAAKQKLSFLTSNCFQEKIFVLVSHPALASPFSRFCFSRFYSSDFFSFVIRIFLFVSLCVSFHIATSHRIVGAN